jgi:hypothetical protein
MSEHEMTGPLEPRPEPGEIHLARLVGCDWAERSLAFITDTIIISVAAVVMSLTAVETLDGLPFVLYSVLFEGMAAILVLGYTSSEVISGRTVGKLLTKVRIVAVSPGVSGMRRRLLRWALRRMVWFVVLATAMSVFLLDEPARLKLSPILNGLTYVALVLGFIHPLALVFDRSRGTWDWVCGTRVVRTSRDAEFAPGRAFEPVMPPRERDAEGRS